MAVLRAPRARQSRRSVRADADQHRYGESALRPVAHGSDDWCVLRSRKGTAFADQDQRGCRARRGRTRPLREALSRLHAQAVGTRAVAAVGFRGGAGSGAHESRRPVLHRYVPAHAARRLHADVRTHTRPSENSRRRRRRFLPDTSSRPCATHCLHRADRRVLRPLLREAALSFDRVQARAFGHSAIPARRYRQLPQRPRLYTDHRVQAPDGSECSRHFDRARISVRRGRSLLSRSAAGERSGLQAVRDAGEGNAGSELRGPPRPVSVLQHGSMRRGGIEGRRVCHRASRNADTASARRQRSARSDECRGPYAARASQARHRERS